MLFFFCRLTSSTEFIWMCSGWQNSIGNLEYAVGTSPFDLFFWWSELFSSFPDNTPPSFNNTCPDNMVFYATECSSSALLTWIEPKATDNSGHVSISYPAIRPPVNLGIGLYSVLYSAIDNSGNRANCTFIVQVASKSLRLIVKIGIDININVNNNYHNDWEFS